LVSRYPRCVISNGERLSEMNCAAAAIAPGRSPEVRPEPDVPAGRRTFIIA